MVSSRLGRKRLAVFDGLWYVYPYVPSYGHRPTGINRNIDVVRLQGNGCDRLRQLDDSRHGIYHSLEQSGT